jgi:HTH-type transcriptional regulator/antitoxin HigA
MIIRCNNENEKAIALAEELSHRLNRTPEEDALLDLLVTLIEKFEDEHYPIPAATPLELLKHLMESQNLIQENLMDVIGLRGVVSEVFNGKGVSATRKLKP